MAKAKAKAKKESTALTVITPEEQAYLDSLNVASTGSQEQTGPDRLAINTKSKDADGNKRIIGAWCIENKKVYHDGVAVFRPVRYAYKLIRYKVDADNNYSIAGQSVYFNNFNDEIFDSLGGLALGRKFGNSKNLTPEQRAANRKLAETYLDIFGMVQLGDDEWHPVTYRVRGSKILKIMDTFAAIPKDKKFSQYAYNLETYQVDGANPYWDIKIEPDMSEVLPITPILEFDAAINDYIRETNNSVLALHEHNRSNSVGEAFASSNSSRMVDAAPKKSRMLDDEIPF